MKKILLTGAVLASTIAMNAHASQARLLALGMSETDNDGMYYIKDARNIFLNPAFINDYSNQVIVEWGSTGLNAGLNSANASATTLNANTSTPKAQGGFFRKYGEYNYGIYLGNESNTSSLIRAASSSAFSAMNGYDGTSTTPAANANSKMLQSSDNQIDLFFGGVNGSGMKWAGNFLYSHSKDETRSAKDSAMAIRGGLIGSNWDAHLNLSLASKAEVTDASITTTGFGNQTNVHAELKGKLGIQAGGSYQLPVGRVFGYVKHYSWDQTDGATYSTSNAAKIGGQNGTVKGDFTSFYAGWGHELEVNNGDKIFTSLSAKKTDINLKYNNKSEVRHIVVPVTIGYEAKATDWLTLRGSVIQNIWGQYDNKNINTYDSTGTTIKTQVNKVASNLISNIYGGSGKATVASSTTVNAGATLTFGSFTIDGLIGTTDTTGNATTSSSSKKVGLLSLENLETSVAMTYKF